MKRIIGLLCSVLLLPFCGYSQSNYKPGYVVTLKGDTLRGFIDYREWSSNPDAINFKTTLTDRDFKKLTPNDIGSFNVDKIDAYKSYIGPVSKDITDANHLGTARDTSVKPVTTFFKVLQKGPYLALYSYTDEIKSRYFIGETPGYTPIELGYRVYFGRGYQSDSQGRTITESAYMSQLFAASQKYHTQDKDIQWYIEHADYYAEDLLKVVSKINNISKADFQKSRSAGPAFNLFAGAGINIDNTTTPASSPFTTAGGKNYTSYLPEVSVGANFFANPATRQLQLRLELSVAAGKFSSVYDSKVSPYVPTRAAYNQLSVSLTPQIIYNFYNKDTFKIFGGAGIVLRYSSFSNAYFGPVKSGDPQNDLQLSDNPFILDNFDDTFMIKAGVQFTRNLALTADYQFSTVSSRSPYFQLSSAYTEIGLNYFFR